MSGYHGTTIQFFDSKGKETADASYTLPCPPRQGERVCLEIAGKLHKGTVTDIEWDGTKQYLRCFVRVTETP